MWGKYVIEKYLSTEANSKIIKSTKGEKGMKRRAEVIKINEAITLINDANESTYYLISGNQKALMIDTGNGHDDVMALAREIVSVPIEVINTHGHCDHVYGNMYCIEAWMHPNDYFICEEHFLFEAVHKINEDAKCCPLLPAYKGQIFDLGGIELEVIELFGHTPGSIGLLDRKHRILFSGDAINPYIWLQLEESLPLSVFKKNIENMLKEYGDVFDYHLSGHTKELIPKAAIGELLKATDEILVGLHQADEDYVWFGGVGKAHFYGNQEGKQICYDENKK